MHQTNRPHSVVCSSLVNPLLRLQITGTALLLLLVMAVTDDRNIAPPKGMIPLLVGFIVTSIGLSFGFNCGYAINPARDFGPRLFTLVAGYGDEPFRYTK